MQSTASVSVRTAGAMRVTETAKCPVGVHGLAVSPDGVQLAIACENGDICLVRLNMS